TITDKKLQVSTNNSSTSYFEAEVQSVQDYYAFGMQMPGRKLSGGYRYGFNGKENDNEVKGEGNQQDYGMRIYDGRIGKFLSVDPLFRDYPFYTPYQFAGNKPIAAIDLDGLEELITTTPVRYRVNVSGSTLHGYFKKGYNLDVYSTQLKNPTSNSTEAMVAFRADSDVNEDWSGASSVGTTQSGSAVEGKYGPGFNPDNLNLLTLPGNKKGQSNYDAFRSLGTSVGDLYLAMHLDKKGELSKKIIGIVGDFGPNSQPGEQSPSANKGLLNNANGSGENNVIYIVFPGTAKYWEDLVGKNLKGKLNRVPSNQDFQNAFNKFFNKYFSNNLKSGTELMFKNSEMFQKTIDILINEKSRKFYDEATTEEKKNALKLPKNNTRNSND
ncbi:MAG: hypothetical protein IM591_00265, partial [Chitinophagaceae bacterium]|nr:hypothetical protein [Chitinophagaceae bacterium]